jgi:hypothetical protein
VSNAICSVNSCEKFEPKASPVSPVQNVISNWWCSCCKGSEAVTLEQMNSTSYYPFKRTQYFSTRLQGLPDTVSVRSWDCLSKFESNSRYLRMSVLISLCCVIWKEVGRRQYRIQQVLSDVL